MSCSTSCHPPSVYITDPAGSSALYLHIGPASCPPTFNHDAIVKRPTPRRPTHLLKRSSSSMGPVSHIRSHARQILTSQLPASTAVVPRWTALHSAAEQHQIETTADLVSSGASINAISQYSGYTPLHAAIAHANSDIVQHLLDNGADPSITTRLGLNIIHLAVSSGNIKMVERCIELSQHIGSRDAIRAQSSNGVTPLKMAVGAGDMEIVSLLLETGADPDENAGENLGDSHLYTAVLGNDMDLARILLVHGASPNLKGSGGLHPLHVVGSAEMATLLLDHGARTSANSGPTSSAAPAFRFPKVEPRPRSCPAAPANTPADEIPALSWPISMPCSPFDATTSSSDSSFSTSSDYSVITPPSISSPPLKTTTTKPIQSPLHTHIRAGNASIVKVLLPHCSIAELARPDLCSGETAFTAAVRAKKFDVGKLIVQALRDKERERKGSL